MKSQLCLALFKAAVLIAPLGLYVSGPTIAQAHDRHIPLAGPVGSNSNYRAELPQGSLMVYSATDEFDDGGIPYYAHSSYAIYTINGKFAKSVENQISRSDEIPEIVTLPVGSYIVDARLAKGGNVRVYVVIKAGRTTVDLDSREKNSLPTELASACRNATEMETGRVVVAQSSRQDFGNKIKLNQ
jgi:hypothetical protein